jgi:hypothetical protein
MEDMITKHFKDLKIGEYFFSTPTGREMKKISIEDAIFIHSLEAHPLRQYETVYIEL